MQENIRLMAVKRTERTITFNSIHSELRTTTIMVNYVYSDYSVETEEGVFSEELWETIDLIAKTFEF